LSIYSTVLCKDVHPSVILKIKICSYKKINVSPWSWMMCIINHSHISIYIHRWRLFKKWEIRTKTRSSSVLSLLTFFWRTYKREREREYFDKIFLFDWLYNYIVFWKLFLIYLSDRWFIRICEWMVSTIFKLF